MSGSAWSVKGHGHCQSLPFFLLLSHGSTSRDNDLFGLVQEEEPRWIEVYTVQLGSWQLPPRQSVYNSMPTSLQLDAVHF